MFRLHDAAMTLDPGDIPDRDWPWRAWARIGGRAPVGTSGSADCSHSHHTGAVLVSVFLGVGAVFRGLVFRSESKRGAQTLRATAVVVGLLVVGLGMRSGMELQGGVQVSTTLIQPAPELGPGGRALKANLVNAKTVAPVRLRGCPFIEGYGMVAVPVSCGLRYTAAAFFARISASARSSELWMAIVSSMA